MNKLNLKDYLMISGIIGLLVSSFSLFSYVGTYADSMMMRSFSVSGEAKISASPDIAEFDFGVVSEGGQDVAKIQETNSAKMNKVISFLKEQGIDSKDIKTNNYNLEPRYQYYSCRGGEICPPSTIVGYTVRQNATVKVRDFSKISPLLSGVVKNGANNVSQMRFTFDDVDKLLGQVKGEAVKKAQAKALAMSKTAGFRLGKLLSIEDYYSPYSAMPMGLGGGQDMALPVKSAVAPVVEPGTQDLSASVILRYSIR